MRVLITGKNGYVGNRLKVWLENHDEKFLVDKVSVRDNKWKMLDFSKYDSIIHAAGIAHIKETKENKDLYYKINRDLTVELSQKAKKEGVAQLIFLSSMSVYGVETGVIDRSTKPKPKSNYGASKLEAEEELKEMESKDFKVAIIRPPMIYGENCTGNYRRLSSLARKTPLFPNYQNKRSMLYIDNLSAKLEEVILQQSEGLYLPQDYEYVNTAELVNRIAKIHGNRTKFTSLFNLFIKVAPFPITKKVFGTLVYDKTISDLCETFSHEEAVKLSEGVK
ncbi:NAD-dependent epimerase/dehydratase family protein [Alteribacter natronophilus]|uniref:NAD-dependent epimerase/dehydratase family protein n=1 Tax=Alteribacter natronophilus TaxID=2583810 RepID=UPI00110D258F|nr:NAD-dependent epimerase/dehydratase family protein [Alteribacter natronophilus]TMW72243.1 NAD-dependent epimerase/dehydratase family protein [Alteribacter natronophilus]